MRGFSYELPGDTVMLMIRPVRSYASWNVVCPMLSISTFWSLDTSMRCPVSKMRLSLRSRLPTGFPKNSKRMSDVLSKSSAISSFVLTPTIAATMAPALLPEMTRGMSFWTERALITPKWYMPRLAPPDSIRAVLPSACLLSVKNSSLFSRGITSWGALAISHSSRVSTVWCFLMTFLVPTCVSSWSLGSPIPPKLRTSPLRSEAMIAGMSCSAQLRCISWSRWRMSSES
mmetsp:Transcript_20644/g.51683  ORF Transcript_20644/g.51683 Transcript_20644/m.51683 type:complete len:230 (+) Transcript_20644:1012-1701(+)